MKLSLWPFGKSNKSLDPNEVCPGSGSVFEGRFRRTRCSTSNGLERYLPGDFQASIRYFASCPGCKIERAITKGQKRFVKHTRSHEYHLASHKATVAHAETLAENSAKVAAEKKHAKEPRSPSTMASNNKYNPNRRSTGYYPLVILGFCKKCEKEILIIDPKWEKLEGFRESSPTGPGERWYCNCIGDPFSLVDHY
jgi:hypothetical protein